jgi:hypothetical protein
VHRFSKKSVEDLRRIWRQRLNELIPGARLAELQNGSIFEAQLVKLVRIKIVYILAGKLPSCLPLLMEFESNNLYFNTV